MNQKQGQNHTHTKRNKNQNGCAATVRFFPFPSDFPLPSRQQWTVDQQQIIQFNVCIKSGLKATCASRLQTKTHKKSSPTTDNSLAFTYSIQSTPTVWLIISKLTALFLLDLTTTLVLLQFYVILFFSFPLSLTQISILNRVSIAVILLFIHKILIFFLIIMEKILKYFITKKTLVNKQNGDKRSQKKRKEKKKKGNRKMVVEK